MPVTPVREMSRYVKLVAFPRLAGMVPEKVLFERSLRFHTTGGRGCLPPLLGIRQRWLGAGALRGDGAMA